MVIPAPIAPSKPLDRMIMSAACRDDRLVPNWEKEAPGLLKYSMSFALLTMMRNTMGNKTTMIHEARNSILSKKPIPKNKTKNKSMEIINTGNGMIFSDLLTSIVLVYRIQIWYVNEFL